MPPDLARYAFPTLAALDAVVVTAAGLYGDKASVLTAGTTLYKFVFPAAVER